MPVCALPAGSEAPARARDFVASWLQRWHLDAIEDKVLLAASELVTNAVKHGEPPIEIDVGLGDDAVWIGVSDAQRRGPVRPDAIPAAAAARGRGLLILERVSSQWGVATRPRDGKTIWCLVRLPPSTPG